MDRVQLEVTLALRGWEPVFGYDRLNVAHSGLTDGKLFLFVLAAVTRYRLDVMHGVTPSPWHNFPRYVLAAFEEYTRESYPT